VDLTLDQAYVTVATKLRRVLLLLRYGLLPARSLLLVGDDDLMALTVAAVAAELGQALVAAWPSRRSPRRSWSSPGIAQPASFPAAHSRFLARSRPAGAAAVTTWRANAAARGGADDGRQAAM
jgi:hypothetical protein